MKIKEINSQIGRDFYADFECEHCGHIEYDMPGYDDANFYQNVIPNMKCKKCGRKSKIQITKIMKARISFELEVQDFVEDSDYTFPEAEEKIREMIELAIAAEWHFPDNLKVEIE
jgi:transcription elongation factor Elf1